ncbi:hypothetical protein N9356_02335, partial [Porticoccaceae bacterium]|nr:hypothetical protein [Porticoccaceae bacterium]
MYLGLIILVGSIVVATVNSNNSDNPNTDQENNKQQTTSSDLVISEKNTKSDNERDNSKQKKSDLDPNKKNNKAPVISGSPILEIEQGAFYNFTPMSKDPENKKITFIVSNKPSWVKFDNRTGNLSGRPGNFDVGISKDIVISVSDEFDNRSSLKPFYIRVVNKNDSPVISGTPNESITVGELYSFRPKVIDPDIRIGKDKLLFSIQNNPEWTVFNASTGELKGQPDTGDVDHVEGIIITVTDSQGGSDSLQPFDIVVALNDPKSTTDVYLSESSARQAEITDEQDKSDLSFYDTVNNESAVDPSIQNPIIVKEIIKGSLQPRTSIPNYVNTESTVTGSRVSDEDASEATSDTDNKDLLDRQVEPKESRGVQANRPSRVTPVPTATQSNTAPKVSDQECSEATSDTDNQDFLNSQIETKESDRGQINRPSTETPEPTDTQSNTAPKVSDQESSEATDTDKPNNIIGSFVNTIVNIFTQPSQDSLKNQNSQTNRESTNLDNKPDDDKGNSAANLSDSSPAGTVSSQVQTPSAVPKSVAERRNNEVDSQLPELEEITPVIGNGNQNLATSDNKQNNGSQSSNGSKTGNNSTSLGTDSNTASIPSDSDASKPSIDKVTDSGVSKDTKVEGNGDKSNSNQSDNNTNLELKEIVNLKNSESDNGVDVKEAKDNSQSKEDKAPATPAKEIKEPNNSDMASKKD